MRKNPSILGQGWDRRIPLARTRRKQTRTAPPPAPHASAPACSMRMASVVCVLLGHAVIAPRGPPACGCVHSGSLSGDGLFSGSESPCPALRASRLGVHKALEPASAPGACGNTQPGRPSPGPLQDSTPRRVGEGERTLITQDEHWGF